RKQLLPGLFVAFDERFQAIPALAVHQNVDSTQSGDDPFDPAVNLGLLGQIHRTGHGFHAESLNFISDFLGVRLCNIRHGSFCARTSQSHSHPPSGPAAPARYQLCFSLEFHPPTLASSPIIGFCRSSRIFSRRRSAKSAAPKAPTSSGSSLTFTFLFSV